MSDTPAADFIARWLGELDVSKHDADVVAALRGSIGNGRLDEAAFKRQLDALAKKRSRGADD